MANLTCQISITNAKLGVIKRTFYNIKYIHINPRNSKNFLLKAIMCNK